MGYSLKGFCNINKELDSVTGNTAGFGELSPISRTYSTSKTNLADKLYPEVSLVVFSSKLDSVSTHVPDGFDLTTLAVLNDFVIHATPDSDFADQLSTRNNQLSNISAGPSMVSGSVTLPAWVAWSVVYGTVSCDVKIWLSDTSFQETYDEYDVRVVPPVPNVNDLKGTAADLRWSLSQINVATHYKALELAKDGDPETTVETMELKWIDPVSLESIMLTWALVCYGKQASDAQNQLDAIRKYLLETTGLTPDYWQERVPDIIVRNTLTIIPRWDNVSIRSSGTTDYQYSPVTSPGDILDALGIVFPTDAVDYLSSAIHATTHYKSIGFVAVPMGIGDRTPFRTLYPDYAVIPLNDVNLGRLTSITRDAVATIEEVIRLAEVDDGTQDLPLHVSRLSDNRLDYLTFIVDGTSQLLVTRKSYLEVVNSVTVN